MKKYRIGRIEGLWENFVPPVQGGTFRTRAEIDRDDHQSSDDVQSDSSTFASREASPTFDDNDRVRQRRCRHTGAASPESSVSSMAEGIMDGASFLDNVTRQKIELDLDKYPAINMATQASITAKYRELHQRIRAAGLYRCNYWAYFGESLSYLALFASMLLCLRYGCYGTAGLSLGMLWHQLVFTAHDAGHMGITHGYYFDSITAIVIADFIGGLSMGWWKFNHNVHHIVTNSPEHDPDIEHMPLFAISHRFMSSLKSSFYERVMTYDAMAKLLLRVQPYTYYPFLSLGRFNLYRLSWDYLIMGRGPQKGQAAWLRWLEIVGHIFFWAWFGYGICYRTIPDNWSRFVFVMVSHISSSPLHLQIVLSHFAMSTADLGPQESFAQKMLRTTMDVDCPPWLDWIHGGLQFQAIHHLYPRLPRHNLRAAQKLVQEFCNEVGIPYALYGFVAGNEEVVGRLSEVSKQAKILAMCQETITRNGEFLHAH